MRVPGAEFGGLDVIAAPNAARPSGWDPAIASAASLPEGSSIPVISAVRV